MVKRLTHRILTPTFMGSIPITPVYVKYSCYCWFKSNYPSFKSTEPPQAYLSDFYCLGNKSID